MKRATVLILALLLVPAAGADAKFSSARVCGPSDCREVTLDEGHTLLTMGEAAFSTRSRLASKPPEASPWYRVTLYGLRLSTDPLAVGSRQAPAGEPVHACGVGDAPEAPS